MYHFYNSQLSFNDFYSLDGLKKIDKLFQDFVKSQSHNSYLQLAAYRNGKQFDSTTVLHLAPFVEEFIFKIFNHKTEAFNWQNKHADLSKIFLCRQKIIQRQVKEKDFCEKALVEAKIILARKKIQLDDELGLAKFILAHFTDKEMNKQLKSFISWGLFNEDGKKFFKKNILFTIPKKVNFSQLLDECTNCTDKTFGQNLEKRADFSLKKNYLPERKAITQANYCLLCHNRGKDSCSKGFTEQKSTSTKLNPLGVELNGCPLSQKISEMNFLKKQGILLGSLAIAMIDNPMLAATGHKICNDCMKACIFQKQEPVDIPLIESKVFDEVLRMPYGFEIYNLLTQWNPLKAEEFLPNNFNNKNLLIVGMGPAGLTLAHYLTHQGVSVVGIDGLKIEPLPTNLTGLTQSGARKPFEPIKYFADIEENLQQRKAYGFGGVSEYGITVRWNKNYLTVLRIILERRKNFRLYGSTRFGSTITLTTAKKLGFQHIALAMGAGKPKLPKIKNMLANGVKTASDFLMTLHSQKPNQFDLPSNLQIRLPILVVGGGLTSVDCATESMFYYAVQVEKFLQMIEEIGDDFLQTLSAENLKIAHEYIQHAVKLRRHPNEKQKLLVKWGGAKILYRNDITESPAYRLNHEELQNALLEGVEFLSNITVNEIILDTYGNTKAVHTNKGLLLAKTVLIAAGTVPNITISKEDPEHFSHKGEYLTMQHGNMSKDNFFIWQKPDFSISAHGDQHKEYAGSVVKAMASAKNSYRQITDQLNRYQTVEHAQDLFAMLDKLIIAEIREVNRLTNNVVEIVVKAELAAREFKPGQFYRLQNYQVNSLQKNKLIYQMEPLAMTGSSVNKAKGEISLIVLEMGGSSNFCQYLKIGEIISLMGPTGSPSYIPKNQKVILIGGGLGNAVLFSIAAALRKNNCQVLYFAAYKKHSDLFKRKMIEAAADKVVWCAENGNITPLRKQDKGFSGNVIEALEAYQDLTSFQYVLTIGSDSMMHAVAKLIYQTNSHLFHPDVKAIASINSPMQCMMKEICAQCLQKHIDPVTKEISFKYSCFDQDQDMAYVDFDHLKCRLKQNNLFELTSAKFMNL